MPLEPTLREAADLLWEASDSGIPCSPVALERQLSVDAAYDIQAFNIQRRIGNASARIVGRKIGITSHAVQKWLGVDQPDFGTLLDVMQVLDGATVPMEGLLQPRAEAEVAFVLRKDLGCPGLTAADVIDAIDYLLPAIEIIDSRIRDWKITYEDTIADNASSGLFVLGSQPVLYREVDLLTCGMKLSRNGQIASTGAGAACLGHPLNAVLWLAKEMVRRQTPLLAGDIVLSGALGPVLDVAAGDFFDASIHGLGDVRVQFDDPSTESVG